MEIIYDTKWDDISAFLEVIKKKSVRVMGKSATTQRMGWILDALDISSAQFKNWCGYSLKEWKAANKVWTEKEFCDLVCENIACIK